MEIPIELIAFVAIVLGVIGRTYFPYLKKVGQDKSIEFDYKFILTAIFSGIVTAVFIWPLFILPAEGTYFEIAIAAFIFAWTTDDIANRVVN